MGFPQLLQQLTHLFLAKRCPLCDRSAADILCRTCSLQLMDCQLTTAKSVTTSIPLFAWGEYRGALKQALARLKYHHQADLGFWLGCQLGKTWQHHSNLYAQPAIIPIPLHQQRLQQRGYNQAALIAKGFCRATGLELLEHGLIRIKATQAMHSLGIQDRQTNLQQAFRLGSQRPSEGQPVLLLDDIYTTGTTALTAAETLRQAGYPVVGMATVARTIFTAPLVERPKHSHPHQKRHSRPSP